MVISPPFAGKVVGIIINAGGLGTESAFSPIDFVAAQAFPAACVGVGLMEYQRGHPLIEKTGVRKREGKQQG